MLIFTLGFIYSPKINIKMKIFYSLEDIQKWKSKELIKQWKKEFPDLIQNHHFNICVNPKNKLPLYTFYEYYSGIYFAKKGYKFLFEPYIENYLLVQYKSKELKLLRRKFIRVIKKIIGQNKFQKLKKVCKEFYSGQPDLFIFNPKNNEYFFAEVKSERDRLRKHQNKLIKQFRKITPVKIIYLLESSK